MAASRCGNQVGDLTVARAIALPGVADRRLAAFLLGGVSVTALGAANGGYYAGAWGWGAIGFLWAAGIALGVSADVTRFGVVLAGAGVALLVWTILSGFWSSDLTATGLVAQRQLLYVAAVIGGLAVVRRSSVHALLTGVWAGIVLICGYGLATRLLPDHIGVIDPTSGYRLSGPIGYWNSFGLLAAMGVLIALGLAARSESTWLRAIAAASVPVLLAAQYYTFSRGAWLSLAIAFIVFVAIDAERLQLLLTALAVGWASATAIVLAHSYRALTTEGSPLSAEAHSGHHFLVEVALLAVGAALSVVAVALAERRIVLPKVARLVAGGAVWLVVLVAAVAFTVRFGAPWTAVHDGWHSFSTAPSSGGSSNLNSHLSSFYGSGRVTQWKVSWHQYEAHPWLGGGAGTWADYWFHYRPAAGIVHNVHNEYLEMLSDLGPIGLALLFVFVLVPYAAYRRARSSPLASAAAAALAAFLVHSIVDWDWQLAGVTVPALLCGVALVAAAEGTPLRVRFASPVAIGLVGILLASAIWMAVTRVELAKINSDASSGRLNAAQRAAQRASTLEPWSSEAWVRLGDVSSSNDDLARARTAYQRALDRDPADWQTWTSLAQVSGGVARQRALARAHALNPLGGAG